MLCLCDNGLSCCFDGWCYLPLVADGMATGVWCGRCYYHLANVMANRVEWLADVKANVADGITTGSF